MSGLIELHEKVSLKIILWKRLNKYTDKIILSLHKLLSSEETCLYDFEFISKNYVFLISYLNNLN